MRKIIYLNNFLIIVLLFIFFNLKLFFININDIMYYIIYGFLSINSLWTLKMLLDFKIKIKKTLLIYYIYILLFSFIWARNLNNSFSFIMTYLLYWIIPFYFLGNYKDVKRLLNNKIVINLSIAAILLNAFYGLLQYFNVIPIERYDYVYVNNVFLFRISGLSDSVLLYGYGLILGVIIFDEYINIIFKLIILFSMFLSYSRGAYIFFFIYIISKILFFFSNHYILKKVKIIKWLVIINIILISLIIIFFYLEIISTDVIVTFVNRFLDIFSTSDRSNIGRFNLWGKSFEEFINKNVFFKLIGTYPGNYSSVNLFIKYGHVLFVNESMYIKYLLEIGLIGFLIIIYVNIISLKKAISFKDKYTIILLSFFISQIFLQLNESVFFNYFYWYSIFYNLSKNNYDLSPEIKQKIRKPHFFTEMKKSEKL